MGRSDGAVALCLGALWYVVRRAMRSSSRPKRLDAPSRQPLVPQAQPASAVRPPSFTALKPYRAYCTFNLDLYSEKIDLLPSIEMQYPHFCSSLSYSLIIEKHPPCTQRKDP
jgi:hypothetical protein